MKEYKKNKECVKCGNLCYGYKCMECNKSKGAGSVSRRRRRVKNANNN